MAGNTTLLTTVLICVDAVAQVLSTAPATSPVPAAKAVVPIMQTNSRDRVSITQRRLHFILLIDTSNSCCYFEGAICHSSHRSPAMRTESVRFILSIPVGVQQSRSQVYGV